MEQIAATLQIVEFGPVWVVGKKTVVKQGQTATKFVRQFREDGTNESLQKLAGKTSPDGDIVIWMGEYDSVTKSFTEMPGVFAAPDCGQVDTYDIRKLPLCTMAICTIRGKSRSLTRGAHNKLVSLLKGTGHEPDYSLGFSMEYYSQEKYEKDNEAYEFAYMLPCKPVQG